jgi:hypothetical protein
MGMAAERRRLAAKQYRNPYRHMKRRTFLAAAASAFAAPYVLPARVFGANERIRIGSIGIRNQGKGNLKRFMEAGCDIVGLCDVDANVLADAAKAASEGGHKPEHFSDYRRLLDRNDIDAVVVTTPDHWHALITINACQAGKDVYCEKPLSLTIAEGRRMVTAARENNRVVQTGSQQRSSEEFWKACTLVRNGAIGKVHTVLVGIPDCNHPGTLGPDTTPPGELNYDMWLGPAPFRAYNEKRVHYNFRFWWDYSGGQMTNFGAHHLDMGWMTQDRLPAKGPRHTTRRAATKSRSHAGSRTPIPATSSSRSASCRMTSRRGRRSSARRDESE